MNTNESFSFGPFRWWMGQVEDVVDPEKRDRVRVRVYGYHSESTGDIPTDHLMWASVIMPPSGASVSGVGTNHGLKAGATVFGFFMDGDDAQVPMVMGSLAGAPTKTGAFQFPRYKDESDVNRLARGEKMEDTAVGKSRKQLDTASTAGGGSWTEPASQAAPEYPLNQVRESESGHVEEWDDTPGKERLHRFHKAGTFEEIHPDGTKVTKVVKDDYQIVAGDGFVHISGNVNITVDGNAAIKVGGNADMEVGGNLNQKVSGNATLEVGGSYTVRIGGAHSDTAGGNRTIRAPMIYEN